MPEPLAAAHFSAFYAEVHGHRPFPWQQAVVERILADGAWPGLVDVPTGLGKTSMIDVSVFLAALTAGEEGGGRLGRRRTVFVVDRRLVVDEAYDHARCLAGSLRDPQPDQPVTTRVAAALRSLAPGWNGDLLPVTRMRGAAIWDPDWLERPDVPGVVLGTVDQIGSRLLFRGYGVSDRRRPLDAALMGTDSVLMVDEAHLSKALLTTVEAAQERDVLGLPLPGLAVVQLSATGTPLESSFTLDLAAHEANPEAKRRLRAGKHLSLLASTGRDVVKAIAGAALTAVDRLQTEGRGAAPPAVLVVCNTVDRARAVHSRIVQDVTGRDGVAAADCELLIGRARPIDRPGLHELLLLRLGLSRGISERPFVLVATQTVEVGINLDADALITESASWDALVQRLGRLNRLGRFAERFPGVPAADAVVVHDGQAEGPVYGAARDLTWAAISDLVRSGGGFADVSPLACRDLSKAFTEQHRLGSSYVPVLQVPTLDAWVQTAPVPNDDPPVASFLHGVDSGPAGVLVAWRDGLLIDDPVDGPSERTGEEADQLLTAIPLRSAEQVEVPFVSVRRWASRLPPAATADVDGVQQEDARPKEDPETFRLLVRRSARPDRGGEYETTPRWRWIEPMELRPGDAVVAPSERGGLDRYGWNPDSRLKVWDVSEPASFEETRARRATGVLRLDRDLPRRLGVDAEAGTVARAAIDLVLALETEDSAAGDQVRALYDVISGAPVDTPGWTPQSRGRLLRWLEAAPHIVPVRTVSEAFVDGFRSDVLTTLLSGSLPSGTGSRQALPERDDDDVTASSVAVAREQVTLDQHHAAVRSRAGQIGTALRLSPDLVAVLQDAAGWHDLGKNEERFQAMLHGGDAMTALVAPHVLAKSGMDPADRLAWRRARIRSGLPPGARHEAWSATIVRTLLREGTLGQPYPGDADLVIHLVASHHGHARPWLPLVEDRDPRPIDAVVGDTKVRVDSAVTVDLDHPARFAALNARYGRWGLALLESVVRCADMTVSAEGS